MFSESGLFLGDIVPNSGTIIYEDNPFFTIYLISDGEKIYVHTVSKGGDELLDDNVREQNEFSSTRKMSNCVKVASVPLVEHWNWEREGVTKEQDRLRRRLNDPDYRKFRTNLQRV